MNTLWQQLKSLPSICSFPEVYLIYSPMTDYIHIQQEPKQIRFYSTQPTDEFFTMLVQVYNIATKDLRKWEKI